MKQTGADRHNAREAARAPLLAHAGVLPQRSDEEQEARVRRMQEEWQRGLDALRAQHLADVGEAKLRAATKLSPAELASLEAHIARTFPQDPAMLADVWRYELLRLGLKPVRNPPELVEAVHLARRIGREEGNEQLLLFGKVDPTLAPTVRLDRDPCPDCGWKPIDPVNWTPENQGIHPLTCPSLVGLVIGMAVDCGACKALPQGACEKHRAEARACQGGHVSGPSRYVPSGAACQRCGVFLAAGATP